MEDDEWETEGEEYFRLKIDNLSKIKQQLNKIVKLKSKKYKKLNSEDFVELKEYFKYLNEQVYPSIDVYQNKMSSLKLNNEDYNVVNKPEVGSNLIFEIGKSNLTYVGTSSEYFEATTKIHRKGRTERIKTEKVVVSKPKKSAKVVPVVVRENDKKKNGKEKRKKRTHKFKHKKNSTIYEIKKIDKLN
jgi:hypothetical protein